MSDVLTSLSVKDGILTAKTSQDVEPILERAKRMNREGRTGTSEMKLAATIPEAVYVNYMNINGIDYRELMTNPVHFRRMLADPDLKGFRVWEGKL